MKLSGIETHEHLQAIKKGMVMNMNNKNWVSVWGNAVSIAEHHPEAYAKYIRPLLSQEPLFLQPLPLFMKKCRSPVHAKRKRSATSLFQKTSL